MNLNITDDQVTLLLNRTDEDLLALSKSLPQRFLPSEALFAANIWERLELYVRETLVPDLRRWGTKGSELLGQLSRDDVADDVKVVAALSGFVVARLTGFHDIPAGELAAFALLLIRLFKKHRDHNAGV
jgi:hypothetical protein